MSAASEQDGAVKKNPTPADVIESLGLGRAQIQYLLLAHGVWFFESMQVNCSVVMPVSSIDGWNNSHRSALASLFFVGIVCGSSVGGYLGDHYGRRRPILVCYAMSGIVQLFMMFEHTFWVAYIFRVMLGFAHGLGMAPSLALVSETSPAKYRLLLQALRNIIFAMGQITACVVVIVDDASYQNLHWRISSLAGGLVPLVIFPIAAIWMHDSPPLLAHLGRHDEAKKSLLAMRQLNGMDGHSRAAAVDVTYMHEDIFPQQSRRRDKKNWWQQMDALADEHFFRTLALAVASFSLNCILYGHMYSFPIIAERERPHTRLDPLYQTFMQSLVSIPLAIVIAVFTTFMNCQNMLLLSCIFGGLGAAGFAATAGGPVNSVYYIYQNMPNLCAGLGFMATFQLSVELYPVQVAASCAAIVVASGKMGSFMTPHMFQLFDTWQAFYFYLIGLSVLTFVMTATILIPTLPAEKSQDQMRIEDVEAMQPLITR